MAIIAGITAISFSYSGVSTPEKKDDYYFCFLTNGGENYYGKISRKL